MAVSGLGCTKVLVGIGSVIFLLPCMNGLVLQIFFSPVWTDIHWLKAANLENLLMNGWLESQICTEWL